MLKSLALWSSLAFLPLAACAKQDPSEEEALPTLRSGQTAKGTVKACHDGDTCNIRLSGKYYQTLTVRLAGIDAPEVSNGGQPFGKEARNELVARIKDKQVLVKAVEPDPYGRMVAEIYIDGQNVNLAMVEKGYAEAYRWADGRINKKAYREAEARAKVAKLNIWTQDDYESPGDFRRRTKQSGY